MHSPSAHRLTLWILAAMACGAILGIVLNLLGAFASSHTVYQWLMENAVDGLLYVIGQGFVRLLQTLVVPLVLLSLACGAASMDDIRRFGRIGAKTMALYLATTASAIGLALAMAVVFQPGTGFQLTTGAAFTPKEAPPLSEVFLEMLPRNAFEAMAAGNMLQVIVVALLTGVAISMAGAAGKPLLTLLQSADAVMMKLVWIVMCLAPFGVFALVTRTFAAEGLEAFRPLMGYFLVVLAALAIHALVVYPLMLKLLAGLNPLPFLQKMGTVQLFAFSTASSNATIAVNLQTTTDRLGVSPSIASFSIPLGATINMDGTAIMQGAATVFIAQAYGIVLAPMDYLLVMLSATLASIGTAGVPGVGLVMLSMVLTQVGLPVEGIALIFGIDRLLDMARTVVNVTGDAAVTCVVARIEGALDLKVYERRG